jgi:hypothetical protein
MAWQAEEAAGKAYQALEAGRQGKAGRQQGKRGTHAWAGIGGMG